MKIWTYLQTTPEKFRTDYAETRLVDVHTHDTLPLQMLTYGREAIHTNNWDAVIRKCRGVIFDVVTQEIIARPFEKFFNLKTANMPETDPNTWGAEWQPANPPEPEVWEKMDGFLCTLYTYNGESYIASKGSFHSPHAKWATAWYREHVKGEWPTGWTPVFEGICSSLRIVVDYEKFEGLVLLALVNNDTGEEMGRESLEAIAVENDINTPHVYDLTWQGASAKSLDVDVENFEGYVLVWRRPGQTPFRLKVKYVDYLRLHRMVSGVSAKAIYRGLSDATYKGELNEWLDDSTPWFSKFVSKWVRSLQGRHDELMAQATKAHHEIWGKVYLGRDFSTPASIAAMRKEYALWATSGTHKAYVGILFALLDGKDASAVAWKLTKPLIHNSQPMIHGDLL